MASSAADLVKDAIASGNASASTLTTLQSLLAVEPAIKTTLKSISRTTSARGPATKDSKTSRALPKDSKNAQSFSVHEDAAQSLSPRARYTLATEVVNSSLKVLSEASKAAQSAEKSPATTPRRASQSQRALQSRSSNSTPVKQTPIKPSAKGRQTSEIEKLSPDREHVFTVAECARLGFSFLETVDWKGLGLREMPKLQLETGLVSLCSRMTALGLNDLALKELEAVKKRLCAMLGVTERTNSTRPIKAARPATDNKSLASLFYVGSDHSEVPEARALIITYQLQVLQLLAVSRSPSTTEEALANLALNTAGSPADVILQNMKHSGDRGKAAKQLESLSKSIFQLSPSVSSSADEVALDRSTHVAPLTAFNLQMLGIRLRNEARKVLDQVLDEEKDLAEPASRCLSALLRRQPSRNRASALFDICSGACEELGLSLSKVRKSSVASQTILRVLSTLAERECRIVEAHNLADLAMDHFDVTDRNQARYVATLARKVSTTISRGSSSTEVVFQEYDVDNLDQHLTESLSGQPADYDNLLLELVCLFRKLRPLEPRESAKRLAGSMAGFAAQYSRSFPTKNLDIAQEIVRTALTCCGSSDKLLSWVSKDACDVLIRIGVLNTIAQRSNSTSMTLAWSTNNSAISLARLNKILVLRAVSGNPQKCTSFLMDEEPMDLVERGALLEFQLKCLLDVAHKTKYRLCLQKLLPEMFRRLSKIYEADEFPLRRARVAVLAYQTRESHPELLPPHCLAMLIALEQINDDQLSMDGGLRQYAPDIRATLALAKIFRDGRPMPEQLSYSIDIWQRVLDKDNTVTALEQRINSPTSLLAQLCSIVDYLVMLGEYEEGLRVARLLCKLSAWQTGGDADSSSLLRLARVHAILGDAEAAKKVMVQAKEVYELIPQEKLASLEYHLCRVEYFLFTNQMDECRNELGLASEIRKALEPQNIHPSEGQLYRRLHGRSWLLHSQYMFAIGQPGEALRTAKRSVKVLNSIWSSLERSAGFSQSASSGEKSTNDEPVVEALTNKVSKLNLKPTEERSISTSAEIEQPGAQFWPVATILCSALVHLSDLYAHHGIFNEANYSSESAIKIADAVGSLDSSAKMRYHRVELLANAGMAEEAALCLAQVPEDAGKRTLIKVAGLKAKAHLSIKLGELEEALDLLQEAKGALEESQHEDISTTIVQTASTSGTTMKRVHKASVSAAKRPINQSSKPPSRTKVPPPQAAMRPEAASNNVVIGKLRAEISVQISLLDDKIGQHTCADSDIFFDSSPNPSNLFQRRLVEHAATMKKVKADIQADFSFNSLEESTLSYPALRHVSDCNADDAVSSRAVVRQKSRSVKPSKDKRTATKPHDTLKTLLLSAKSSLTFDGANMSLISTANVHKQYSRLADISMAMSATLKSGAAELLLPSQEALNVDFSRIHAANHQKVLSGLERDSRSAHDQFAWPELQQLQIEGALTASVFQSQYVNILPQPWTAISICLNDACDELYIAKYRRGQEPLVLRLPFSRQKSDETDEDVFDFELGRAELKQIVELSDFTCHQTVDTSQKGAKTAWWNEREELDRRLQGLLMNMENIWFGGFKGILSCLERDQDRLDRFRKALEAALERHLPSRKANKKASERLVLHDHILELFIGLGPEVDGLADIDECLVDLLYFVVDIFQFNGERNAYDEVDFDSMAIEILDAIRDYHDDLEETSGKHLILVLDRRLQAFPWESMPCLEKTSVSRVDSMQTLHDRIIDMRTQTNDPDEPLQYSVPRASGSYILNPSSDLKATESMLQPALSKLAWTSIVGQEPSEEIFSTKLSVSSSLLYFGHGAGSQYIRPRVIRRLEKCSPVVWLMGCSSGAVTEYDELEPFAVPLAYMQAGGSTSQHPSSSRCLSVVATLWDVTDKDIDRFSLAVGEEWGLFDPAPASSGTALPAKTPRKKGDRLAIAPRTPEKSAKTPKTPRVKKTPAAAVRTPARNRSRSRARGEGEGKGKKSLVEAVMRGREACYLRYLNGAAPIVFGVPVYLGD